jgi:ribonucleoside-diphosphate reductase alpha chain
MRVWDAMCATILSTGARRGAMMATLSCDHPDIEEFIDAKRDPLALRHFNLRSVTDHFLEAVRRDDPWPLVHPAGSAAVARVLPARELWARLLGSSYEMSEPGVLFVDTINRENNLAWRETLTTTNPCGEVPLPPYGACNLGSINLPRFVRAPFTVGAALDLDSIEAAATTAVRFLDDVLDVTRSPLPEQAAAALATRRIGLGITGLADALCMLGLRYDSQAARDLAATTMRRICLSAYAASASLAVEKARPSVRSIDTSASVGRLLAALRPYRRMRTQQPPDNRARRHDQPAAGNASSGIEPIRVRRQALVLTTGKLVDFAVTDGACGCGVRTAPSPRAARRLRPSDIDRAR